MESLDGIFESFLTFDVFTYRSISDGSISDDSIKRRFWSSLELFEVDRDILGFLDLIFILKPNLLPINLKTK